MLTFLPPSVARAVCLRKISADQAHQGSFSAAVLFSDISGFTMLTGKLAEHGLAGAEELTTLLNRYFGRMIELLEREGGEVVQFSGDAMTVVFPCEDQTDLSYSVRRAWQAGQQMQQVLQNQFTHLHTSVGEVEMGMKVSIGAGQVHEYYLGVACDRWYYLIAGDPLTQVAEAEHRARRGDVVLSPEALALFPDHPVAGKPVEPVSCEKLNGDVLSAVRSYAPEVITRRLEVGQSEWLAEIRLLSVLFFSVQGLQYGSVTVLRQAQDWMDALLETVRRCGGTLNKLLVDDKGTVGIALFGAPPFAHLDDPLRAVRCAIDLEKAAALQNLKINIGLTTGWVFAGPVGGKNRREYTVMGDAVNLAARLMQSAAMAGGGLRSDDSTHQACGTAIEWEVLPRESMKGFSVPVPVYRPIALSQLTRAEFLRPRSPIVGREREFDQLVQWAGRAFQGQSQVVLIDSEPGMGRASLLTELLYHLHARNIVSWIDRGDPLEEKIPYSAWRGIFRSYFGIQGMNVEQRRERVWAQLQQIAPYLIERAPLFNDLLGLDLPESDLTTHLSPHLRQASLESLLLDLIGRRVEKQPLLIAIEETEYLDSLSWQLILKAARSFSDSNLMLVITAQTLQDLPETHPMTQLQALPQWKRLILAPLDDDAIIRLCITVTGANNLPDELKRLIVARAAGSPLVAEQIIATLSDRGILKVKDGDCEIVGYLSDAGVPDTLHGLVLNKIDLLDADQQLTLKVAAVIGRTFGFRTLFDVYPLSIEEDELQSMVDSLIDKGLIQRLESENPLYSHTFRQAIFQEVTYQTILHAQSSELHVKIAGWYEKYMENAGEQSSLYPRLAYHWRQAEVPERELFFATKASRKLLADYANHEALSFLDRALQLETDLQKRYELMVLRLKVHERLGNRLAQREDLEKLHSLVESCAGLRGQKAGLANAWAEFYRSQAQYIEAQEALHHALDCARQAGDQANEARSLTLWGQVLEHQGMFHEAREYFHQALAINRGIGSLLGEAENLSRLSSIARSLGEKDAARDAELHALQLRRDLGDKASEAASLINLALIAQDVGDSETAWNYRQAALLLTRAVGDRAAEALNMSTIGMGHLMKGDYASALNSLKQALRLNQTMGNRLREAECQNILGAVCRDLGDFAQARGYFEKALAIQEAIGNRSYATYTYLNLGYVLLNVDPQRAKQDFETALKYATETGNREAEAYAYSYLALFCEHQQDWNAARRYYAAALPICRELQAWPSVIEGTAGLARIALQQGEIQLARQYGDICWNHLQSKGSDGIEFPMLVYLTCYDVYSAGAGYDAARQVLEAAHRLLVSRSDLVRDTVFQDGMLQGIPENKRVLALWQRNHPDI